MDGGNGLSDSKILILRLYMDVPFGGLRHQPFHSIPVSPQLTRQGYNNMSGSKRIRVPPDYQIVRWETLNTKRGVKQKQVSVFTQKAQSQPATPSRLAMSPDGQQHFDADQPEPLMSPGNTVSQFLFIHLSAFL